MYRVLLIALCCVFVAQTSFARRAELTPDYSGGRSRTITQQTNTWEGGRFEGEKLVDAKRVATSRLTVQLEQKPGSKEGWVSFKVTRVFGSSTISGRTEEFDSNRGVKELPNVSQIIYLPFKGFTFEVQVDKGQFVKASDEAAQLAAMKRKAGELAAPAGEETKTTVEQQFTAHSAFLEPEQLGRQLTTFQAVLLPSANEQDTWVRTLTVPWPTGGEVKSSYQIFSPDSEQPQRVFLYDGPMTWEKGMARGAVEGAQVFLGGKFVGRAVFDLKTRTFVQHEEANEFRYDVLGGKSYIEYALATVK